MLIFNLGIKLLLGGVAIFFGGFFYICFHWADGHTNRKRAEIGLMNSAIYSFLIFIIGTIVIAVVALGWEYGPGIINFVR